MDQAWELVQRCAWRILVISAMRRVDVLWDFENRLSQKAAEKSGIKAGISKKMGMTASIIFKETMIDEMSDA